MKGMIKSVLKKIYRKSFGRNFGKDFFFTKDFFQDKRFEIGDFTYGRPKVLFENDDSNLIIGKYCSISTNVTIFLGGNHRMDWITTYPFNALPDIFPEANDIFGHPATKGDVKIGNDVWIGNGATILSGVIIGDGAVIGAGALIAKNVGAYEVWVGNPAKFLKKRFDEDTIKELQRIKWWDWNEAKVKENVTVLQSNNFKELK